MKTYRVVVPGPRTAGAAGEHPDIYVKADSVEIVPVDRHTHTLAILRLYRGTGNDPDDPRRIVAEFVAWHGYVEETGGA